uniref:Uncharacterized protein n=1 Tax=Tanacetum cinerariifolium TaxID=118510 RepID=A0A6L2MXJ5_TANCI|nr:hypothetical protein [Tanacetum cinerariifolium]
MTWVYFLKHKSETFECFKKFKSLVEKQSGSVVKILRSDRGARHKLDRKSHKYVFIGYCPNSKAYRLYDPVSKKITVSRDVVFHEFSGWNWEDTGSNQKSQIENEEDQSMLDQDEPKENDSEGPNSASTSQFSTPNVPNSASSSRLSTPKKTNSVYSSEESSEDSSPNRLTQPRRSERGLVPRRRFPIEGEDTPSLALFVGDPVNVEEAMKKEEWRLAMKEELSVIEKNQTWELTDLPREKMPLQQGIDYEETFVPVARFETVRIVLAIAAQNQWKLYQFDVKSAFLNGELKEEVYIS